MMNGSNFFQKIGYAGILFLLFVAAIGLASPSEQSVSAMKALQVEETHTSTPLTTTPTPTLTLTPTFISGVLSCNTVTTGVTCINHGTYLEFVINKVVTGLTGGATASNITIGTFKRTTTGGWLGMMSNFMHSETSNYQQNWITSRVSIKTPDAGTVYYDQFANGPGTYVSVNNIATDWRYVGGSKNFSHTLSVRGNVDYPITGYSVVGTIYLYSNEYFVTQTPTPTATVTFTPTIAATNTFVPGTPQSGGNGTCWAGGGTWNSYTVYFDIVLNGPSAVPPGWVIPIHDAKDAWNDVVPSQFQFVRQIGSANLIKYETPTGGPLYLADVTLTPSPPGSPITNAIMRINPNPPDTSTSTS